MKTNYIIALNAQWKAPWRMPQIDNLKNAEASGNLMQNKLQDKLGETVKGVQDFIKKNWLE